MLQYLLGLHVYLDVCWNPIWENFVEIVKNSCLKSNFVMTWPYSVNIKDIKVIFVQNKEFYVENSKSYIRWVVTDWVTYVGISLVFNHSFHSFTLLLGDFTVCHYTCQYTLHWNACNTCWNANWRPNWSGLFISPWLYRSTFPHMRFVFVRNKILKIFHV